MPPKNSITTLSTPCNLNSCSNTACPNTNVMAEMMNVSGIRIACCIVGLMAFTMAQTSNPKKRIGPTKAVDTDTNKAQQISS